MTLAAALLLLLQVSAPGPENMAYHTCLLSSASAFLRENPSSEDYRLHIGAACKSERATLRRVIVEKQSSKGLSRAQAEADADEFFAIIGEQMLALLPVKAR